VSSDSTEPSTAGGASGPFGLIGRVGIVGVGLMGGSLAKALRGVRPDLWIQGSIHEDGAREAAVGTGVLDAVVEDPLEAVRDVDLVVLATPLSTSLRLLGPLAESAPGALLTDVGSLKAPILECARHLDLLPRFVGGHPMAGSERSGWGAAHESLYHARPVWLVEDGATDRAKAAVAGMWESVGAIPRWTDGVEHDRTMVWTSHLPQLASTALAEVLEGAGFARRELGPGGTDATRLAGSSPELWADLFEHAPSRAADAVRSLAGALDRLADSLQEAEIGPIEDTMTKARRWKERSES